MPDNVRNKRKILVVDDHADTVFIMERLLTLLGHEVVGATGAAAALDVQRREAFDFAFIDVAMPGMTGIELLGELQKIRPLPAAALSGQCMPDEVEEQLRAGFKRCIAKPCLVEDLVRAVEDLAV